MKISVSPRIMSVSIVCFFFAPVKKLMLSNNVLILFVFVFVAVEDVKLSRSRATPKMTSRLAVCSGPDVRSF